MRRVVGSVREVSPGVWEAQVSAGSDPSTGRRIRPTKRVHGTATDAEMLLARMLLEAGAPQTSVGRMGLKAFFEDVYLPSLNVRQMTMVGYRAKLKVQLAALHSVRLESLTPYQVQRLFDDLRRAKVDDRTALHAFRLLRAGMRKAVAWGLIASDPTASVKPPHPKPRPLTLPDVAAANRILDAFAGHPVEPAVVLALAAGLRRSEIAGMRWTDVDLKAGTVTVRRGLHQRGKRTWEEEPKTERSKRTVALPQWAVDALKRHRGMGALIPLPDGSPTPPDAIASAYKERMTEAKLPWVPLMNLRHAHATIALASGVDIVVVSRRLGHSTVSTTDAFYLRPDRSADEDAAERMDGFRRPPKPAI